MALGLMGEIACYMVICECMCYRPGQIDLHLNAVIEFQIFSSILHIYRVYMHLTHETPRLITTENDSFEATKLEPDVHM